MHPAVGDRHGGLCGEEAHVGRTAPLVRQQAIEVEAQGLLVELQLRARHGQLLRACVALADSLHDPPHEIVRDGVVGQVAGTTGQAETDVAAQEVLLHAQVLHVLVSEGLRPHLTPDTLQDRHAVLVERDEVVVEVHAGVRVAPFDVPRDLDAEQRRLRAGQVWPKERRRRVVGRDLDGPGAEAVVLMLSLVHPIPHSPDHLARRPIRTAATGQEAMVSQCRAGDARRSRRCGQLARTTSLRDLSLASRSDGRPVRYSSTSRAHSRPSRDGPHDERLAAPHVAGHEDALTRGPVARGGAVAALVDVHAEVLEDGVLRVQEAHGQQHQLGRQLVLAARDLVGPPGAPVGAHGTDGAQGAPARRAGRPWRGPPSRARSPPPASWRWRACAGRGGPARGCRPCGPRQAWA